MGTITIRVPQDVNLEYEASSLKSTESLLATLKELRLIAKNMVPEDRLLGLFADDSELLDQVTESAMRARENDPLRVL